MDVALIKNYVDLLEKHLGIDLIIYDECKLLSGTELSQIRALGKWHTNRYCLKIKENKSLHKRCIYLKDAFLEKISGIITLGELLFSSFKKFH